MRTTLSFAILILLASCAKEPAPRYAPGQMCKQECLDPYINVIASPETYYPGILKTCNLRMYERNSNFTKLVTDSVITMKGTAICNFDPEYDYEFLLPDLQDTFRIWDVAFNPPVPFEYECNQGTHPCINGFKSINISLDSKPIALTTTSGSPLSLTIELRNR